jgi:hypothetical protein
MLLLLSVYQFSFLFELLAAVGAVGNGIKFPNACAISFLRSPFVCSAVLMHERKMFLHWFMKAELAFQII